MVKANCHARAEGAKGEKISDKEINEFAKRMQWARETLQKSDPAGWAKLNAAEKIRAQADFLGQQAKEYAEFMKKFSASNRALTTAGVSRNEEFATQNKGLALEGLRRSLKAVIDGKNVSGNLPLEQRIAAKQQEYKALFGGFLADIGRATKSATNAFFGKNFFNDATMQRAFLYEAKGMDATGLVSDKVLPIIRDFAKTWKDKVASVVMKGYNDAGGNIKALDDYLFPQSWDRQTIIGKDMPQDKENFVNTMLTHISKNAYLDEKGVPMTDAAKREMLGHIFEKFRVDDNHNLSDTNRISSAGSARRILHFDHPDSYLAAMEAYGRKDVAGSMWDHLDRMAKNTAIMEHFGNSPDESFAIQIQKAEEYDRKNSVLDHDKVNQLVGVNKMLYDYMTHKYEPVIGDRGLADAFSAVRNVMTGLHMGWLPIKHISDIGRMFSNQIYKNTGLGDLLHTTALSLLSPRMKDMMEANGVGLERYAREIANYGKDVIGPMWSRNFAKWMIGATGISRLQSAVRRSYSGMIFNMMHKVSEKYDSIDKVSPIDQMLYKAAGLTDDHFQTLKLAQSETVGGKKFLTPRAVRNIQDETINVPNSGGMSDEQIASAREKIRDDTATRLLNLANQETSNIIVHPDAQLQATMRGMAKAGTWAGELTTSALQFKNYTISVYQKMGDRLASMPDNPTRALVAAKIGAGSVATGFIVNALVNLLNGKDVDSNLTPGNFAKWAAYGGDGLVGETIAQLLTPSGSYRDRAAEATSSLIGPVLGTTIQLAQIPFEAAIAKEGDGGDAATKQTARFIKSNFPFKTFYTQAIIDRVLLNEMMDWANPGYNERVEQKMMEESGAGHFIDPTDLSSVRTPHMAFGEGSETR